MDTFKQLGQRIAAAWTSAAAAWSTWSPARALPRELTEVLEHSVDGVIQTDAAGAITYLNPAARRLLGLGAAQPLVALDVARFAAIGTRRQIAEIILPALHARGVWLGETRLRLGRQRQVPFSLMALAHRDAAGGPIRFSAVVRDISPDVLARKQIQRQNDILSALSEALPATVVVVDSHGRYRFVNSAFARHVGLEAAQILGRTAVDVLGADEVARRKPFMKKAMAGEAVDFTLDYPGPQGATWLALSCIPLKLNDLVDGFVGISQDITMQRREQERLAHLAERDPLTGVLNRAGLAQRLEHHKRWNGLGQGLLYIDLDHFKPVNDRFGHHVGDQLLQMFARRVTEAVRSSDVVARLGGDEFAVLLTSACSLATADVVARKLLDAASRPFVIDGRSVQVSASIGIAILGQQDDTLQELLARADHQMYRAKAGGRGRHCAPAPEPALADRDARSS